MERNDYRPASVEDKQTGDLIAKLEKYGLERSAEVEKQGLKVDFTQSHDPGEKETYLDEEMRNCLYRLFFETKDRLDEKLGNEGFVDLLALTELV